MKLRFLALGQVATLLFALLETFTTALSTTANATCGCYPDPHFQTWDNIYYDYHGGCDLILIQNARLSLHVSTVPTGGYARVSKVLIYFEGSETLEIQEHGNIYLDGASKSPGDIMTVGGYPFVTDIPSPQDGPPYVVYQVNLSESPEQFIRISEWPFNGGGLSVQVLANGDNFAGSEGMCGSWNSGGVRDRSGLIPLPVTDTDAIAAEWQVTYGEHKSVGPYAEGSCTPSTCTKNFPEGDFPCDGDTTGPDGENGGRVFIPCERTCNDIPPEYPELRSNCVFDVIVTNETNWACAPAYINPVVILQHEGSVLPLSQCVSEHNKCQQLGGICVEKCCTDDVVTCIPDICSLRRDGVPDEDGLEGHLRRLHDKDKPECYCAVPCDDPYAQLPLTSPTFAGVGGPGLRYRQGMYPMVKQAQYQQPQD